MDLFFNQFIEALGYKVSSKRMQALLKNLGLPNPVMEDMETQVAWLKYKTLAFEMAFVDEEEIKGNPYADIGDGELEFMTVYFNKPELIEMPYGILANDDKYMVTKKIGRECDKTLEWRNSLSWIFKTPEGLVYVMFFDFNEEYKEIHRVGIVYSYGQLEWVEELKKKKTGLFKKWFKND